MRVLMLTWHFWPGPEGGAERQCRILSRELAAQGVECEVVTRWATWRSPRREDDGGVVIRRIGWLGPAADAARRLIQAAKRRLRKRDPTRTATPDARPSPGVPENPWGPTLAVDWLERIAYMAALLCFARLHLHRFQIIHVHESTWLAGFAAALAASRGIPVLVKETLLPVLRPLRAAVPWGTRWDRLRRGARFVALTPEAADGLVEAGIPRDRVELIPNGVVVPAATADVASRRSVLYVGNFYQGAHHKAFDVLLAAWQIVHRSETDARLVLVGAGDTRPWEALAHDLGVADTVHFVGPVPNPADHYREAAVFVLPSRLEGLSNALLEAQSWGLPAVVSDIPGNRRVVRDGVNGLVVPTGDAAALAAALQRLLADPALRVRQGAEARRAVAGSFSLQQVAARYTSLYRSLSPASSGPT